MRTWGAAGDPETDGVPGAAEVVGAAEAVLGDGWEAGVPPGVQPASTSAASAPAIGTVGR
jgi:hypothetical protein